MEDHAATFSTFVIERAYTAPPERVFAAFSDPAQKRRWFGEGRGTSTLETFETDFRVGGRERIEVRMGPDTPIAGTLITNRGEHLHIVPNRLITIVQAMNIGEQRISTSLVTIELVKTATGTDLICTHQGAFYEGADGPQMREEGWRTLFERLAEELGA